MSKHTFRFSSISVLLVSGFLAGCSTLVDESDPSYQKARQLEQLELPPDLTSSTRSTRLPGIVAQEASAEDLQGFEKFKKFEQFDEFAQYQEWKAQRSDDERLDFEAYQLAKRANERSGQSGAGVKIEENFSGSTDIRIKAASDPSFNYVTTALGSLEVFVLSNEPDKYKIIAEIPELKTKKISLPSAKKFTIQIFRDKNDSIVSLINHRGKPVETAAGKAFQIKLANQLREVKLRSELANQVESAATLAGELRNDENGHLLLDLEIDQDDLFQQIDYLLDQIGFTVVEKNADDSTFKVRFSTEKLVELKKTGLSKLAFWKKAEAEESTGSYVISIEPLAGGSRVRVTDANNKTGAVGDDIIEIIREKL
ncbi:MAG: putative lipoprotein [Parasphingorhabdus sp.]|jgi:uncharacterized lipoprotein